MQHLSPVTLHTSLLIWNLLLKLKLTDEAGLAVEQTPGILISQPTRHRIRSTHGHAGNACLLVGWFVSSMEAQTQVPVLAQQTPTGPSLQP